jgi:uncharacterized membrane protein
MFALVVTVSVVSHGILTVGKWQGTLLVIIIWIVTIAFLSLAVYMNLQLSRRDEHWKKVGENAEMQRKRSRELYLHYEQLRKNEHRLRYL